MPAPGPGRRDQPSKGATPWTDQPGDGDPGEPGWRSLVIGVSRYQDADLQSLPTAEKDAKDLALLLRARGHEVTAPHPSEPRGPTLDGARAALEGFVDSLTTQDTALYFFCGHGAVHRERVWLFFSDTPDVKRWHGKEVHALPLDEIVHRLAQAERQPKATIIVLHLAAAAPPDVPIERLIQISEGIVLLLAWDLGPAAFHPPEPDETSFDAMYVRGYSGSADFHGGLGAGGSGNSVFTGALLEALSGAAGVHHGEVLTSSVARWVQEEVARWRRLLARNRDEGLQPPGYSSRATTPTVLSPGIRTRLLDRDDGGHDDEVTCLVWSPDGSHLMTCGVDGRGGPSTETLGILWNANAGRIEDKFEWARCAAWLPDGRMVIGGYRGIHIRDARGRVTEPIRIPSKSSKDRSSEDGILTYVECISVSPDGNRVLVGSENGFLQLAIEDATAAQRGRGWRVLPHSGDSWLVPQSLAAYAPMGQQPRFLVGSKEWYTVDVWNQDRGKPSLVYSEHMSEVGVNDNTRKQDIAAAWSPDGKSIASSAGAVVDHDGQENKREYLHSDPRIWDAQTGKNRVFLRGHHDTVCDIGWSPDGGLLATASRDGSVRLWDGRTGRCRSMLHYSVHVRPTVLAFSPRRGDDQLAVGFEDGSVRIFHFHR